MGTSEHDLANAAYAVHVSRNGEEIDANTLAMIHLMRRHYAPGRIASPDWKPWIELHDHTHSPLAKALESSGHVPALRAAMEAARSALCNGSHAALSFPGLAAAGAELPLAHASAAIARMRGDARTVLRTGAAGLMGAVKAYGARRVLQRTEHLDHRGTRLEVLKAAALHTLASRLVLRDGSVVDAARVARDVRALADCVERETGPADYVSKLRTAADAIAASPSTRTV